MLVSIHGGHYSRRAIVFRVSSYLIIFRNKMHNNINAIKLNNTITFIYLE